MEKILNIIQRLRGNGKAMPDWLFVFWAGGTALLSYSLVYALRKPFTAAEFDGMQIAGMDYKIVVSMIQLIGYVCAKMLGIKFISELKPQNRLKFIVGSAALSEVSLLTFALVPAPLNIFALFFNGLSLGCMWGVIFSFLEGRRTTDILASIMGVSMALSSGVAKSLGLYALHTLHVSEFWMPALIGAVAFPLLCLAGWVMTKLPRPTAADIALRSERVTLNARERMQLFRRFMPVLLMLFIANLLLTVQRDIKEDFIVCIIDVHSVSSWAFAYIDGIATLVLLGVFAVMSTVKSTLHPAGRVCCRNGSPGVCRSKACRAVDARHGMAVHADFLHRHSISELPDNILRALHCLLQDSRQRGILHHNHRLHRLCGHARPADVQGTGSIECRLGCVLQPDEHIYRSCVLRDVYRSTGVYAAGRKAETQHRRGRSRRRTALRHGEHG